MSRPVFVRALRKAEKAKLEGIVRSNGDARVFRRALMVRLSAKGKKATEIADLLGISRVTVNRTIHAFGASGLAALRDRPRSGRPRKVTERYASLLKEAVRTPPREMGFPFNSWTLARLREYLARETETLLHPAYLSRLMRRHGIVYRRPRHVMSHLRDDAEYEEKKAILEFLKKRPLKGRMTSTSSTSTNVRLTSIRP